MANKIKVLGLDDDNHSMCFITRGSYYSDAADFMKKCLLDAHTVGYDLRVVRIADLPEGLEAMDPTEVDAMFELLSYECHPKNLLKRNPYLWEDREKAFDLFWEHGDKEFRYV